MVAKFLEGTKLKFVGMGRDLDMIKFRGFWIWGFLLNLGVFLCILDPNNIHEQIHFGGFEILNLE